ncbi:MAG: isoprenyl transferase [Tissierellia bacterium]|nr:isoprenyl transferase [Tissierellia bacterium]
MTDQIHRLDKENIPKHICIIMDGNGRWATSRMMPRSFGHKKGMERVVEIVESCRKLGIKHLSLYAFSTENWKRPKAEVNALMGLLVSYIRAQLNRLIDHGVRVRIMGDITPLPELPRAEVLRAMEETQHLSDMTLNIGINYGGRDEILHATRELVHRAERGELKASDLTREMLEDLLYTSHGPDPDLLIRPGGEQRISNFMIYQIAYSELYFTDVLWPDFDEAQLIKAIDSYQNRNRRFGGV